MFSVVRMKKCQNDERPSFDVFDGTKGAQIRHRLMFDEEIAQNDQNATVLQFMQ